MSKLHVKTGDPVVVISGKDADKKGKVLKADPSKGKIIVEGVNMSVKHEKPKGMNNPGGRITTEAPIFASKVMLVCPRCGKATRVAHKFLEDGSKVRLCKKCGETFEK